MVIDKNTIDICTDISAKIAFYFGVDIESIYVKKGTEKMQNTREFSWFILHYEYLISINKLSVIFRKNASTITRGISKIKCGITNQKYYQSIYKELKEHLDKTIGQSN